VLSKNKRIEIKELLPENRIENFCEVVQGYNALEAKNEALRCLDCKHKPCVTDCPVNIDIPDFIKKIIDDNLDEALMIIHKSNSFPGICGRVCPQEKQCQLNCVRGLKGDPIEIGELERFVADNATRNYSSVKAKDKKVAVIGSGPSSLACAAQLLKAGIDVTLYEALHALGGVMRYGIPEFRLPRKVIDKEISQLVELGLDIKKNIMLGQSISLEDLFDDGFQFIYLGIGAGTPRLLNVKGENLNGVYSANEFLTRVNLMQAYRGDSDTPIYVGDEVLVVGGGNVALDAARAARRLTKGDVSILYRRTKEEMPARKAEIEHTLAENINLMNLLSPKCIIGSEGWVSYLACDCMELTDEVVSGRRKVIKSSQNNVKIIKADTIIVAIGQNPSPLIRNISKEIELTKWGTIKVNDRYETTLDKVYAGGDIITGASTVISAIAAGKDAANEIIMKLI